MLLSSPPSPPLSSLLLAVLLSALGTTNADCTAVFHVATKVRMSVRLASGSELLTVHSATNLP